MSSFLSRWAFSFHLVHVGNLHAYTMWARTEEDKNKWVAAIREALSNVQPQAATAGDMNIKWQCYVMSQCLK